MPKTSEMMKKGKFIKKEDLEEMGGEQMVTIVGVKLMNVAQENSPPDERWVMKFRELEQLFILNNTNVQLIEKALGSDDSADWRGKQITIYVDENVSFGGKLVGGIRVRVQRQKPAARPVVADEPHEIPPPPKSAPPSPDDWEDDIPF